MTPEQVVALIGWILVGIIALGWAIAIGSLVWVMVAGRRDDKRFGRPIYEVAGRSDLRIESCYDVGDRLLLLERDIGTTKPKWRVVSTEIVPDHEVADTEIFEARKQALIDDYLTYEEHHEVAERLDRVLREHQRRRR